MDTTFKTDALMPVVSPNGDAALSSQIAIAIMQRGQQLRKEFAAIVPDGTKAQQPTWTELKKIDAELKAVADDVEKKSHAYSEANRILLQIEAERKAFKALYGEKWEEFCKERDKDLPPAPTHLYFIELSEANEAQLMKVLKMLAKDGIPYRYGEPTVDKDFIAAKELMKAIRK